MTQAQPLKIFLAYADKDEKYLDKVLNVLKSALTSFIKQGLVSFWDKRQIAAGTDKARVFDENFQNAQIVLLLFSSDFMISDFMNNDIHVQNLLERHATVKTRVIPIRLRPMAWDDDLPFAGLDYLPTGENFLSQWTREDEALYNISEGVKKVIKELLGIPGKPPRLPDNSPTRVATRPIRLLKEEQTELEARFNELSRLVKVLQEAIDKETQPLNRIQFESQLEQKQAYREEIAEKLAEIEMQLSQKE